MLAPRTVDQVERLTSQRRGDGFAGRLTGGGVDDIARLNERHPTFAWLSLFSVGLTDLYIRLVSMGVIRDLRIVF